MKEVWKPIQIDLICGVGINDADYLVEIREELPRDVVTGKRKRKYIWQCPFYSKWKNMIWRCYSAKQYPTYEECSVVTEWLTFSKFKSWMEQQDWEGNQLDKDILVKDNKTYGPNTCVFVSKRINTFMNDCRAAGNGLGIGVHFNKQAGKFQARCRSADGTKRKHLGYFDNPKEANLAWLTYKLEQAKILASEQKDIRVAKALVDHYSNWELFEFALKETTSHLTNKTLDSFPNNV